MFERRQRVKVEAVQVFSRRLGKWMFTRSRLTSRMRDMSLPFYSIERLLEDFRRILEARA